MTTEATSTPSSQNPSATPPEVAAWREVVAKYQQPSRWRASWQLINTFGLYVLLWALLYWSRSVSYWLAVPLTVLAGGILVRVFIIFHDCGHGSFFKSKTANDVVGFIAGVLTFTPYYHWRWEHAVHHASAGNLDRRGTGDVWTMTVQEFLETSRAKRFAYRLARNPVVLFVLAPLFLFVVWQRFPSAGASPRDRQSVQWMNLAILIMATGLTMIFGLETYLLLQLGGLTVAASAGVWMFYVQHQFEDVYWERGGEWDFTAAALQGSSFYQLPRVLQWFTGNIGFHHIHHLSSRIPNYNLERCHRAFLPAQEVKPITLRSSLKSLALRLWDEEHKKLVGYREMRAQRKQQKSTQP
jgi:omega-6 fatty acid desaturase (delta-12 desaturase)